MFFLYFIILQYVDCSTSWVQMLVFTVATSAFVGQHLITYVAEREVAEAEVAEADVAQLDVSEGQIPHGGISPSK